MEWYIMNSSGVRSLATGLGELKDDNTYKIHDECADTIDELLMKISSDDLQTSITKQHLDTEQIITRDLLPIIKYGAPDTNELQLALRLLAELCQPVPADIRDTMKPTAISCTDKLADDVCELFRDEEFVSRLIGHLQDLIEEDNRRCRFTAGGKEMATEGYEVLNSFLNLIRNVLYSSEKLQNINSSILYTLMRNDLASIVLFTINCHSRTSLAVSVAQVLGLLYKEFQWNDSLVEPKEISTEEFVCDKLQKLIVQLLQGSLAMLATSLKKAEVMSDTSIESSNYLTWCLAYFLPFLSRVPISILQFRQIMSSKFVGFLVYQASLYSLNLFKQPATDSTDVPINEKTRNSIYLVMSALDGIISLLTHYPIADLNREESQLVIRFYADLAEMKDLWNILLLYIRSFDLTVFDRSFLSQLVTLNHKLLLAVEFYHQLTNQIDSGILEHVQLFASPQVIRSYTSLVESYSKNSVQTNMAVFTMLCHISVECNRIEALYTASLLKALSEVNHLEEATTEDRSLARYVTESFLADLTKQPDVCINAFMNSMAQPTVHTPMSVSQDNEPSPDMADSDWSADEEDELMSAMASWHGSNDMVKQVLRHLLDSGYNRTRAEIVQKMDELETAGAGQSDEEQKSVENLVAQMIAEGNEDMVYWIHRKLLAASYMKAMPKDSCSKSTPIYRYSYHHNHEFPLIPWTEKQETVLRTDPATQNLLSLLGLYRSPESAHADGQGVVPTVPIKLSAGELYSMAERLYTVGESPFQKLSSASSSECSSEGEENIDKLKISQSTPLLGAASTQHQWSTHSLKNVWLHHMQHNMND